MPAGRHPPRPMPLDGPAACKGVTDCRTSYPGPAADQAAPPPPRSPTQTPRQEKTLTACGAVRASPRRNGGAGLYRRKLRRRSRQAASARLRRNDP